MLLLKSSVDVRVTVTFIIIDAERSEVGSMLIC